tara:strand:+ start:1865 stop:2572 length:708 start_codon:yes stop_codon:yes gene_type:complete
MTNVDFDALAAKFNPEDIKWRVGATNANKTKGLALAYLDARAVMDRLDCVVGQPNWQATYSHAANKTVCELSIRCGDDWITKANGAGDSDIEGEKGALSDAFKRAAVLWGIGRYLYNLDSPWVELDQHGKRIKQSEMPKLQKLLGTDPQDMPPINIVDTSKYGDFVVEYEDSDEFVDGVAGLIYSAKSTTDLEAVYRANIKRLKKMQHEDAETWAVLQNNFAEKKSEVENGKAAA